MRRWRAFFARHRTFVLGAIVLAGLAGLIVARPWEEVRKYVGEELGIQRVEALAPWIEAAARESAVDPHLIAAIVFLESRGRADAISDKDALGLMQLVDAAASDAAQRLGLPAPSREELLSNAALNLRLGADHLAWLLENRGAWNLEQVLVSYNAGRTRLSRWIEEAGSYSAWRSRERDRIDAGEEHTGSLLYATRALDMRDLFESRGRIRNPLGLRAR